MHTPGVLRLLGAVDAAGLTNVRVAHEDAIELLRTRVAPGSLDAIRVYFPDPWPKARHHKRRLVQPRVVAMLATRLRVGGTLHLATDVADYADTMLAVVTSEPLLRNDYQGFAPRPAHRPLTRYEAQGLDKEHPVADLLLRRVEDPTSTRRGHTHGMRRAAPPCGVDARAATAPRGARP